jgi:hypothetical protein
MSTPNQQNYGSPFPDPSITADCLVERYKLPKKAHEVAVFNSQVGVWQTTAILDYWSKVANILLARIPPKKARTKRMVVSA